MRAGTIGLMIAPVLLLAACQKEKTPAEQAAEDARAIAMVEAAQTALPPPEPLDLQPITSSDVEKNALYGAGCSLVPASNPGGDPILVASERRALVKLSGRYITFAADAGSEPLTAGVRTHYVGKAQALVLEKSSGSGTSIGDDALRWQGRVTIRDAHDQLVYSVAGDLLCTSSLGQTRSG